MYIVVTNDKRLPLDIVDNNYELWTLDEFIEKASTDPGITVDSGLYINVEVLDKDLYEDIVPSIDEFKIVFYQFSDVDIRLPFNIATGIKVYDVKNDVEEEVEEEAEEEILDDAEEIVDEEEEAEEAEEEAEDEEDEEVEEEAEPEDDDYEEAEEVEESENNGLDLVSVKEGTQKGSLDNFNDLFNDTGNYDKTSVEPAKIYLFGSLKGGVGKSTTCVMAAHVFAKNHPHLRVAVWDLDLSDGQVSPLINKVHPTLGEYYKKFANGMIGNDAEEKAFVFKSNSTKSDKFPPNVDFYLAPKVEILEITDNMKFWDLVMEQLLLNYDVVFIDSGTEYLTKEVISKAYKIADRIILISNTSISSVKSVLKQLNNLSGRTKNNVYSASDEMLPKTRVVLTRASTNNEITQLVANQFKPYTEISAAFGSIEPLIESIQWYQRYNNIYDHKGVVRALEKIVEDL